MPGEIISLSKHRAAREAAQEAADRDATLLGQEAVQGAATDLVRHLAALALEGRCHDALIGIDALQGVLAGMRANIMAGDKETLRDIMRNLPVELAR
ncbi:hypothetical protein ROS1_28540 [Roseibium sp. ROS1]